MVEWNQAQQVVVQSVALLFVFEALENILYASFCGVAIWAPDAEDPGRQRATRCHSALRYTEKDQIGRSFFASATKQTAVSSAIFASSDVAEENGP